MTATHAAIDDVTESTVWSLPDAELAELTRDCHRLESRFAELSLRLVAEADRRQTERSGATSTQTWLRRELNLTPAAAKQQVTVAAELAGPLELTREALAAGDLSRAHVEAIVRVMDALPSSIGSKPRADAERQLIAWCREFDPREVARLGRRLWEVIDPDGADAREAALLERQEREAKQKRSLAFGTDGFGRHLLRGLFDLESAATIAAALDPLAKPMPSTQTAQTGARRVSATPTRWSSCVGDSSRPTTCPPGVGRSRRSSSPWSWTSCVRVSDRVCWTPVTACHPTPCASWPCDAQIVPALLGTDGQPLDLGRATRTFTAAQRRALGLRDGQGCAFPGCDRPMTWCEGHHIRHWIDGVSLISPMGSCSADTTTRQFTRVIGWCSSPPTADRISFHRPGSIRTENRSAITSTKANSGNEGESEVGGHVTWHR